MVPGMVDVSITDKPLDLEAVYQAIYDVDCGAQLIFLGCTRKTTDQKVTKRLTYQAYLPMAQSKLEEVALQALEKWSLRRVVVCHRLGPVDIGQPSVVVAVASPHRKAAMEAVPWMMNAIKNEVPIWKQETFEDNTTSWVHPTSE